MRIEAATWRGRPVWFDVQGATGSQATLPPLSTAGRASPADFISFALVFVSTAVMAWRNWKLHRVELRGALQLQFFGYVAALFVTVPAFPFILVMYLAVEPYLRRYWPDSLISWQRLSRGSLRDPLVATHVLAGVLAATVMGLVYPVLESLVTDVPVADARQIRLSRSIGSWTALAGGLGGGPANSLLYLTVVVLMRLAIPRLWLADVLAVTLFNVPNFYSTMGGSVALCATMLVPSLVWIWLMRRFGFLSVLALFTIATTTMFMPHHLGGWLGERLLLFYAVPVLVAAWAVWVIVSARQQVPQGSPAYVT